MLLEEYTSPNNFVRPSTPYEIRRRARQAIYVCYQSAFIYFLERFFIKDRYQRKQAEYLLKPFDLQPDDVKDNWPEDLSSLTWPYRAETFFSYLCHDTVKIAFSVEVKLGRAIQLDKEQVELPPVWCKHRKTFIRRWRYKDFEREVDSTHIVQATIRIEKHDSRDRILLGDEYVFAPQHSESFENMFKPLPLQVVPKKQYEATIQSIQYSQRMQWPIPFRPGFFDLQAQITELFMKPLIGRGIQEFEKKFNSKPNLTHANS